MEYERPAIGRPRLRSRRVEVQIRVTAEQKRNLRLLADARNMSIGELIDEYVAKKYGIAS